MKHVTLPHNMEVDGITHTTHYKDREIIIIQNYSSPVQSSQNPLEPSRATTESMYHVHLIVTGPGEELGERIGSFTNLQGAMEALERLHATESKSRMLESNSHNEKTETKSTATRTA